MYLIPQQQLADLAHVSRGAVQLTADRQGWTVHKIGRERAYEWDQVAAWYLQRTSQPKHPKKGPTA